jgi:membrane protease YdiL (CAAX protease family)
MKNILIFAAGVLLIAWTTIYAASVLGSGDPAITSAGMSLAAFGPLLMAALLRKRARQGWSDAGLKTRFGQNRRWYAFGLLFIPLVIVLTAAVALGIGVADVNPEHAAAVKSMWITFAITIVPMLFLSIGEEFGWRGYLEPALGAVSQRIVLNHIFIGIIWGLWHFPLLIFAPGNQTNILELLMVVIACVTLAIIYGQLRLRSESVWPCVLLHGMSNAAFISVGSSKLIQFDEGVKDIISFNTTSAAMIAVWLATGLLLLASLRRRAILR